jgi:hypothetical protein
MTDKYEEIKAEYKGFLILAYRYNKECIYSDLMQIDTKKDFGVHCYVVPRMTLKNAVKDMKILVDDIIANPEEY